MHEYNHCWRKPHSAFNRENVGRSAPFLTTLTVGAFCWKFLKCKHSHGEATTVPSHRGKLLRRDHARKQTLQEKTRSTIPHLIESSQVILWRFDNAHNGCILRGNDRLHIAPYTPSLNWKAELPPPPRFAARKPPPWGGAFSSNWSCSEVSCIIERIGTRANRLAGGRWAYRFKSIWTSAQNFESTK